MLPPLGDRLLPALSGVLLVLSFPPVELLFPPFVALVPFLVFIAGLPPGREARSRARRAGYFLGMIYFGLLLYWQVAALIHYSILAIPTYVLTILILSALTAAFATTLHYVLERTTVPLAIGAAVLWTTSEWVQGHMHDLSFPWLGLGASLAAFPTIAGAADLVGARGLTFWIALVNGLLATMILRARVSRPLLPTVALLALTFCGPVAYGVWRAHTLEPRPVARIAVVQPNIPEELRLDRTRAVDSAMVALTNLTSRIPAGTVDLVVWPEVAIPYAIERDGGALLRARIGELSEEVGAPILAGAYGLRSADRADPIYLNSAFVIGSEGTIGDRYHKRRLVPFVERVPFIDAARLHSLFGDLRRFGGLGRGTESPVLGNGQAAYGVLICYESIFAPLARRYRLQEADFLLNITNDAWFGREEWRARTSALWQHPAHLPLRAIETRLGIARAANTGISMFIDPLGHRYEETELFVPDVRTATVFTTDGLTLYARWGDWLGTSAVICAVLLLLAGRSTRFTTELAESVNRFPRLDAPNRTGYLPRLLHLFQGKGASDDEAGHSS